MTENGFDLIRYKKGKTYDVAPTAAATAISAGWAEALLDCFKPKDTNQQIDNLNRLTKGE